MRQMQSPLILALVAVVSMVSVISGCSRTNQSAVSEEGEESGTELALDETYDNIRNGARLILAYDAQTNAFKGTVEKYHRRNTEAGPG